jgi:hypothetical protein
MTINKILEKIEEIDRLLTKSDLDILDMNPPNVQVENFLTTLILIEYRNY